MKLKITTIGNSAGVILPKELLARLRLEKGDELLALETPDGIRLTIVWSVPDAAAWWRQRGLAGQDPSVVAFWADLDELLVSRDRRVCEELDR